MNYFACKKIEYLFFRNAELDSAGEIVPKTGFEWEKLFFSEKPVFKEESKNDAENVYLEQNLTTGTKYDSASDLINFLKQHFILKLQKENNEILTWGSIEPKNPVVLTMKNKAGISTLTFSRKSTIPEI